MRLNIYLRECVSGMRADYHGPFVFICHLQPLSLIQPHRLILVASLNSITPAIAPYSGEVEDCVKDHTELQQRGREGGEESKCTCTKGLDLPSHLLMETFMILC